MNECKTDGKINGNMDGLVGGWMNGGKRGLVDSELSRWMER